MTPHAKKKFRSISKCENHMQNGCAMQKMENERFVRPWQPVKGIPFLCKTFIYVNCPTPPLLNYINLRGLPKKHRIHENRRQKSQISSRNSNGTLIYHKLSFAYCS
jgi:hypothetical protein